MLKLNLGSGSKKREGWINVDKFGSLAPDQLVDLERFPWPWPDDSADEIYLSHVLEHLGQSPDVFIGIMKELWRVCRSGARIEILVPDPRSDDYLGDPTHVRPVTVDALGLFCQPFNRKAMDAGWANTPLGILHGVDFDVAEHVRKLDPAWRDRRQRGELTDAELEHAITHSANVVREHRFILVPVKPARFSGEPSGGRDG